MKYKIKTKIGIFLTLLMSVFMFLFAKGIQADIGEGSFYLLYCFLLVPFAINLYAYQSNRNIWKWIALGSSVIFFLVQFLLLFILEKPIHTEIADIYDNISTLYFSAFLYLIGEILILLDK